MNVEELCDKTDRKSSGVVDQKEREVTYKKELKEETQKEEENWRLTTIRDPE